MKIKDENGNEIEVYTVDELKAKTEEAVKQKEDEFNQKLTNAQQQFEAEKNQLTEKANKAESDLAAAIASGGNKEQIDRLRNERDAAIAARDSGISALQKDIQAIKDGAISEKKKDYLDKFAGSDTDLRKKIELEFDRYRPGENTPEAIAERMEKAYTIVTGAQARPGIFDGGTASFGGRGSGGFPGSGNQTKQPTANEVAIGNVLGITEEDRKNAAKLFNK